MVNQEVFQALTQMSRDERLQIVREALQLMLANQEYLTDTEREDLQMLMLRKMNPVQRPARLLTADEVKAQLARNREKLSQAAQKAIPDYAGDKELTAPTDFDNQDFYEYD